MAKRPTSSRPNQVKTPKVARKREADDNSPAHFNRLNPDPDAAAKIAALMAKLDTTASRHLNGAVIVGEIATILNELHARALASASHLALACAAADSLKPEEKSRLQAELKFSASKFSQLAVVGRAWYLRDEDLAPYIPDEWSIQYYLARMPKEHLLQLVAESELTAETTRAEAEAMAEKWKVATDTDSQTGGKETSPSRSERAVPLVEINSADAVDGEHLEAVVQLFNDLSAEKLGLTIQFSAEVHGKEGLDSAAQSLLDEIVDRATSSNKLAAVRPTDRYYADVRKYIENIHARVVKAGKQRLSERIKGNKPKYTKGLREQRDNLSYEHMKLTMAEEYVKEMVTEACAKEKIPESILEMIASAEEDAT